MHSSQPGEETLVLDQFLLLCIHMIVSAVSREKRSLESGPRCHVLHKPETKAPLALNHSSLILISVVFHLGSSDCSQYYICLW